MNKEYNLADSKITFGENFSEDNIIKINDEEDEVHSSEHDNQLRRFKAELSTEYNLEK